MMRGCFCDCFGGFKNPFSLQEQREPLDPNAINRCLDAVRAHEQNEKNRYVSRFCAELQTTRFLTSNVTLTNFRRWTLDTR